MMTTPFCAAPPIADPGVILCAILILAVLATAIVDAWSRALAGDARDLERSE